jgi:hypothetical protein
MRRHLTYANVVSTLCLFIALGGTSYAAIKVTGQSVKDGSLTGADVRNNSLKSSDISGLRAGDFSGAPPTPGQQSLVASTPWVAGIVGNPDGGVPTGWFVAGSNTTATQKQLRAWVVCASP